MSWRVVKCVLEHHGDKTRGVDLLVLIYLANHANGEDGSGAWPSQRTLAGETGLAHRTVRYALARLVEAGALEVDPRPGRTHRFRVRLCAVCLPRPSEQQMPTRTNTPRQELPLPRHQMPTTPAPDATEPLSIPPMESPTNAVSASPPAEAAAPARPAGTVQEQSARNRKAEPCQTDPSGNSRSEFLERRVEQIRRDQGDRAANAYLAKVAQNDVRDRARATAEQLQSGHSPAGYRPFVPAWAQEQWQADHPNTDLNQETGS